MFFLVHLSNAQEKISIGIYNDVKLGLGLDKEHLNPNPTLDLIINVNLEGKQLNGYYFSLQPFYEQANLHSGYFKRYGFNTTWTFNSYYRFETSITTGLGMILRHGIQLPSYQIGSEVSYELFSRFKIALKYEFIRRGDIQAFRHNVYGGFKYDLVRL